MKIAIPVKNDAIFQHFGMAPAFKVYTVENTAVAATALIETPGQGHSAKVTPLVENQVDCVICGGIGAGARTALAQAGIELYPGVSGDALAAVQQLAAGNLAFDPDTTCSHHHEEGHTCGEHDCGEHTCGGHHSGECR